MSNIEIKEAATEDHVWAASPLLLELCLGEGEDRLTPDLIVKNWHITKQTANYTHFNVYKDADVIATFGCQIIMGPTFFKKGLEVSNLIVNANHRRQGIAKKIMDFCHQYAHDNDCDFIRLFRVKGNVPADKLYQDLGYSHTADLMFYEFET